ncbi:hypothetical protein LINPERHAP1_LOCUS34570 [Linum perenne]
MWLLLVGG